MHTLLSLGEIGPLRSENDYIKSQQNAAKKDALLLKLQGQGLTK